MKNQGCNSRSGALRGAGRIILLLLPFGFALAFWFIHPNVVIDVDSQGYLDGWPVRTATYHLFLRMARGPMLLPAQLFLFAAALSWFSVYCSRFLPWSICAAMLVVTAANPFLWQLQGTILSEALTVPLLTIIGGCIIGFAATRCAAPLVVAAACCGVATTIRPSLLPMIIAPISILWLGANVPDRIKLSFFMLLAWSAPVAAERLYSHAVHGPELTSYMGRQAFLKAAVIDAPPTRLSYADQLDRRLLAALNEDYGPVRRLIDHTSDRDVRYILLTNYEACAGYPFASSLVAPFKLTENEIERHLLRVGLARLSSNPLAYLSLSASEFPRMWLLHPRKAPNLARKYNAFLQRNGPLPFQALLGDVGQPTPQGEQSGFLSIERKAFAAVGIISIILIIILPFSMSRIETRSAFAVLVGTQGVLVLSALLGVGLPRYAMGMWPVLVQGELLGLAGLLFIWKPEIGSKIRRGTSNHAV